MIKWIKHFSGGEILKGGNIKIIKSGLSFFYFLFNLFLYFLFIELRVRVRVEIGHSHKSRDMMKESRRF